MVLYVTIVSIILSLNKLRLNTASLHRTINTFTISCKCCWLLTLQLLWNIPLDICTCSSHNSFHWLASYLQENNKKYHRKHVCTLGDTNTIFKEQELVPAFWLAFDWWVFVQFPGLIWIQIFTQPRQSELCSHLFDEENETHWLGTTSQSPCKVKPSFNFSTARPSCSEYTGSRSLDYKEQR